MHEIHPTTEYCPTGLREHRCCICGRLGHITVGSGREMKEDALKGQLVSPKEISFTNTVIVANTKIQVSMINGNIFYLDVE